LSSSRRRPGRPTNEHPNPQDRPHPHCRGRGVGRLGCCRARRLLDPGGARTGVECIEHSDGIHSEPLDHGLRGSLPQDHIHRTRARGESWVTDVLGTVTSGEADAGLVYVTDVIAAGNAVTGITFPESGEAVNTYPIAPVTASENPDVAQAFVDFITGDVGQY